MSTQNNTNPYSLCANRIIFTTETPSPSDLVQVVGLSPLRDISKGDCRGFINFCLPVISSDFTYFLLKSVSTSLPYEDLVLEKYNGATWDDLGSINASLGTVITPYDTFSNRKTYYGFRVDWSEIFSTHGVGEYRFLLGSTIFSYQYTLVEDTCDNKDKTILFNCNTKGIFNWSSDWFESIDYDTTTAGWTDSIRLKGRFEMDGDSPNTETSRVNVSLRNKKDIHKTITNTNYRLYIPEMPIELYNRLFYFGVNSKSIEISDHNLDASEYYINRKVVKNEDVPSLEQYRDSHLVFNVEIRFRDDKDFIFDE